MQISAETIYKTLYFRTRNALHHLLVKHLRRSHSLRHGKRHSRKGERGTINIVNGISIHERSGHIDNRRSVGHWEGDLVSGTKNTHIATLVDRKSRYTILLELKGRDATLVNDALIEKFKGMPFKLRQSLTWDRGMELAKHADFTANTGTLVSVIKSILYRRNGDRQRADHAAIAVTVRDAIGDEWQRTVPVFHRCERPVAFRA